jgi:hypothetical protein
MTHHGYSPIIGTHEDMETVISSGMLFIGLALAFFSAGIDLN